MGDFLAPSFVITVSGSDASGSAGMQADNRAIHAMGAFPLNVVTALTLQTDQGVQSIDLMAPELIRMHLVGLLNSYPVKVIKAGMLGSGEIVQVLVDVLVQYPDVSLVLDPVLKASSGRPLLDRGGIELLRKELLLRTLLITPNLPELAELAGLGEMNSSEQEGEAAQILLKLGCQAVLVKGGHRSGEAAIDRLFNHAGFVEFTSKKIVTQNTRGTGCALASLIAGGLANGLEMTVAVDLSKKKLSASLDSQVDEIWPGRGPGFV